MRKRLTKWVIFVILAYFQPYRFAIVRGPSMYPSLKSGNLAVYNRWILPDVGDVCVLTVRDEVLIKRVGGLTTEGAYCLGDNAGMSMDSRDFGIVPNTHILGRVCLVIM